MNSTLERFLRANDLDSLLSDSNILTELNAEDIKIIGDILQNGTDKQAIANLLMYPNLIPQDIRFECVFNSLQKPNYSYFLLAAIVGLDKLEFTSVEQQVTIFNQLISIIENNDGVIGDRASNFLSSNLIFFHEDYSARIVHLLDHPSNVVRHNILSVLIPLIGLENIRSFMDNAVKSNQISETAHLYVERRLSEIKGFSEDNTVDGSILDLGTLSLPLLSYIPNLKDWYPE